MSLQELSDFRELITQEMKRRFEQHLGLVFTDVVGSTAYIAEHGDVAGRALLQRHHAVLDRALETVGGRVVDTAGDGAFCVTDSPLDGAKALMLFQQLVLEDNNNVPEAHHLQVRSGMHWGTVLADDQHVSGESVHAAARIAASADAGEIRLSDATFRELPTGLRLVCRHLGAASFKGLADPVDVMMLDWRNPGLFPTKVEIVETGETKPIPFKHRIAFGRLAVFEGHPANDIVLEHPDSALANRVSRWHFVLEMTVEGYMLRPLGRALTEVDGVRVAEGQKTCIRPGSVVCLSNVLTLRFAEPEIDDATVLED